MGASWASRSERRSETQGERRTQEVSAEGGEGEKGGSLTSELDPPQDEEDEDGDEDDGDAGTNHHPNHLRRSSRKRRNKGKRRAGEMRIQSLRSPWFHGWSEAHHAGLQLLFHKRLDVVKVLEKKRQAQQEVNKVQAR